MGSTPTPGTKFLAGQKLVEVTLRESSNLSLATMRGGDYATGAIKKAIDQRTTGLLPEFWAELASI